MGMVLRPVLEIVAMVLNFFYWCILLNIILSWLVAFDIINTRNSLVERVVDILYKITEPFLRPLRRILPQFGGIDFSSFALILIIYFLQRLIFEYMYKI